MERITRHAILIRNDNKTSKAVVGALIDFLKCSALDFKSITFDNGSEFANHSRLKDELGIDAYFCNPGAPWQKGSIENLNGMLRRFFPFKVSAEEITNEQVAVVNTKINDIPREILSYKTPNELLNELCRKEKKGRSRMKAAWPTAEAVCFNQKESGVAFGF